MPQAPQRRLQGAPGPPPRRHTLLARLPLCFLAALLIADPAPAFGALWDPWGVPVCGDSCVAGNAYVIPDGAGGIFVAWRETRNYAATGTDAYLQRLTATGQIAPGWPRSGLPVCALARSQEPRGIAPDGQGGAVVMWYDHRNAELGSLQDIYAQRVRGDGTIAPGWPANGAPVTRGPDYQDPMAIAADGTGGAYVAWQDWRDWLTQDTDVYAQHVTAAGTVADGWPPDGLPVCTAPEYQFPQGAVPDGAGGVVLVWDDGRRNPESADVYAQRLLPDGTIPPGWVADGVPVALVRGKADAAPDGANGFYMGYSAFQPFPPYLDVEYYVQRFTFDGTRGPGWPEGGVRVVTAPDGRDNLRVAADGAGGLLMAWFDYRGPGAFGVYALRVLPDGAIAPGWTANGVLLSDTQNGQGSDVDLVADGLGGAYVSWEYDDFNTGGTYGYVQHLTVQGAVALGWPVYGERVAPSLGQFNPRLAPDGSGGAIVVWDEAEAAARRLGLFAQRFAPDGPTPAQVSLVSVEPTPTAVRLRWYAGDGADLTATVYRRDPQSDWIRLGTTTADGTGALSYDDRMVTPGARYAYRLGLGTGESESFSAETWVEVPLAPRLALAGLRPNPATGPVQVAFSLPDAASATLELLDVSGRRVAAREVGSLGAGDHLVRLDEGARLAAGLYWLRLRQGGQSLLAKAIVVR